MVRAAKVTFAYLVQKLRGIPGAGWVERHVGSVAAILLIAAALIFGAWMAQRSPQRVSLGDLRGGAVSAMQRWIIVEGELESQGKPAAEYIYKMTDPNVADTQLIVYSTNELPVGHNVLSGNLIGGTSRAEPGFAWIGQLRVDPTLAQEQETPWLAIGLTAVAIFLLVASRTVYPVFFTDPKPEMGGHSVTANVGVRPEDLPSAAAELPGTLTVNPGTRVSLMVDEKELGPLRLHSAQSSLEVGELRRISKSDPAMALHMASGDVTLTFPTNDERNEAFNALAAHLRSGAGAG